MLKTRILPATFLVALNLLAPTALAARPPQYSSFSLSPPSVRRSNGGRSPHRLLSLRGGGDVNVAATDGPVKLDLELTPAKVGAYVGAAALAAFTIAIVKKVPRSGGHAPQFVAELCANLGVSELGATGLFHLAYFAHCFLVIAIMPSRLKEIIFGPGGVILLGTVFPLVESIKAAARSREDSAATSQAWLMYWVMHGIFSFASHDMAKVIKRFGPRGGKHWFEFQFYSECLFFGARPSFKCLVHSRCNSTYLLARTSSPQWFFGSFCPSPTVPRSSMRWLRNHT